MIASALSLSRADCKALALTDAYGLHKLVYSLFPEQDGRKRDFLYVDKGGDWNCRRILLLSARRPKTPEFGVIESREIQESFLHKDYYAFEVTVNPTRRNGPSRTTTPIRGRDNLHNWFMQKSSVWGFAVDPDSLHIRNMGVVSFGRENGVTQTHGSATFVGKLQVTNREAFVYSFKNGVGRAKGFGFGLLQIVPLQKQENLNTKEE
ncbi:MAG: type I-E CRISPR-associated protein Cas6/Cse3/CasE [Selenomonadales bacterium]|nr:type I-E CRISPR-associated protein Cas6/Cse3/CasE [Selenomonadales bacterium]